MVAKFIYENIIIWFDCSKEFVNNRSTHFINSIIKYLIDKYLIKHRKFSSYHPRANGQIEKTNGMLCKIITKIIKALIVIGMEDFQKLYGQIALLMKPQVKPLHLNMSMDKKLIFPLSWNYYLYGLLWISN